MVKKVKRVHGRHYSHLSPSLFVVGLAGFALVGMFILAAFPAPNPTGASFINLGSQESAWTCTDGVTVRVSDKNGVCRSSSEWSKIISSFCTVSGDISFSQTCIITASCTDSDDGVQYYIPGTAVGYDAAQSSSQLTNVSDNCIDATHLREWFCDSTASSVSPGSVLRFIDYECSYGCSNHACVSAPQSLTVSRFAFFRTTETVTPSTFPSTSRSDTAGTYWLLSNPVLDSFTVYMGVVGNDAPLSSHYTATLVPIRDTSISYEIAVGDAPLGSSDPYVVYNLRIPISGLKTGQIPQTSALAEYTLYLNISTNEATPRDVSTTQRVVLSR